MGQVDVAADGSTPVVLVALGCNLAIAAAKFVAAASTGSSAMLSEAIHSVVDSGNQALLTHGHPFGYSRELYFWSFVVAVLLFSMGAGISIYEGIQKLIEPHPIAHPQVNYIVLSIALALEGVSTYRALQAFNKERGDKAPLSALRASKDPALFTVLLEDFAALAGLLTALAGVAVAHLLGIAAADAIASLIIGLILALVAAFIAVEVKGLLIGEAADEEIQSGVLALVRQELEPLGPARAVNGIRTLQLGAREVLVDVSLDMNDSASAADIEAASERLRRAIRALLPEVRYVFVEIQSSADFAARRTAVAPDPEAAREGPTATGPRVTAGVQQRPSVGPKKGKGRRRKR